MNIPQEAIEAAAQALSIHWKAPHTNEALGRQRALAEHALTAALHPRLIKAGWTPPIPDTLDPTTTN